MINWINGEPVKVQTSPNIESLILRLNRVQKGTGKLELLDKHGFKYYAHHHEVDFIIPDDVRNIMVKGDQVSKYFDFKEGDLV